MNPGCLEQVVSTCGDLKCIPIPSIRNQSNTYNDLEIDCVVGLDLGSEYDTHPGVYNMSTRDKAAESIRTVDRCW